MILFKIYLLWTIKSSFNLTRQTNQSYSVYIRWYSVIRGDVREISGDIWYLGKPLYGPASIPFDACVKICTLTFIHVAHQICYSQWHPNLGVVSKYSVIQWTNFTDILTNSNEVESKNVYVTTLLDLTDQNVRFVVVKCHH